MGNQVRSWSILREPLFRPGEQRLAIEREGLPVGEISRASITEQAFGEGRATLWDSGEFTIRAQGSEHLVLEFHGTRLSGQYELRRMRWYPGNRWLLKNVTQITPAAKPRHITPGD